MEEDAMVPVTLDRIVIRDGTSHQYIFLGEAGGSRGFPIVIGHNEALEIRRMVHQEDSPRPLTHQLTDTVIRSLGARLASVDIVDLRRNTFYAQLVLHGGEGEELAVVDARPSDAIALALRARCPIRVADSVLERADQDEEEPEA